MTALPTLPKVSKPDELAVNRGYFMNGSAPTASPVVIQPSSAPANTEAGSVWLDSTSGALMSTLTAGGAALPVGSVVVSKDYIATSVDDNIFIADRAYKVRVAKSVPSVIASSGPTTCDIKKCTGTTAPASGTSIFASTTFDLVGVAQTVQTPALTATAATLLLAAGDRLARDFTGTMTAATGTMSIVLDPA